MLLVVQSAEALGPQIRRLVLASPEGAALPGFAAGAHIRVQVALPDGRTDWRAYSLIDARADGADLVQAATYEIAVRLDAQGGGGSRYMHQVQPGQTLTVEPPRNDFALDADATAPVLLLAGGIGVTPLVSMAAQCRRQGRRVRMVYAARTQADMAYRSELQALLGDALQLHEDAAMGGPLSIAPLLDRCAPHEQVYVCGPVPMLDAVLAQAQQLGWPRERVHFELFGAAPSQAGDQPFELVLQQSGQTLQVPADQTILSCLLAHGHDPLYDCQRGECGICAVPVIEGAVDHRDHSLSESEKASGKVIQICVSRAKGERLVLDL